MRRVLDIMTGNEFHKAVATLPGYVAANTASVSTVAGIPGQRLRKDSHFAEAKELSKLRHATTTPALMQVSSDPAYGPKENDYRLNSLVNSPMPSIATVTLLTGSFIDPTPSDVPQQIRSPGNNVMSCEILLTSCAR